MAKDWRENEDRVHSEKYDPGHVVHRLLGRWRDLSAHYQRPESLFWALPQDNKLKRDSLHRHYLPGSSTHHRVSCPAYLRMDYGMLHVHTHDS